jgi:hypothetical protein
MATQSEVEDALLDLIKVTADKLAAETSASASPDGALKLAEAYAWLLHPAQPHGSGSAQ